MWIDTVFFGVPLISIILTVLAIVLSVLGVFFTAKSLSAAKRTEALVTRTRDILTDINSSVDLANVRVEHMLVLAEGFDESFSNLKDMVESAVGDLGNAIRLLKEVQQTTGALRADVRSIGQSVEQLQGSVQGLKDTLVASVETAITESITNQASVLTEAVRSEMNLLTEKIDDASTELYGRLDSVDQEMKVHHSELLEAIRSRRVWVRVLTLLTKWTNMDYGNRVLGLVVAVLCLMGLLLGAHLLFDVP